MSTDAFEKIDSRWIAALGLEFDTYVHRATGARHLHLACADTNNAFMVAFPTLPCDSTGVAHMLEHTTLCGSHRYPVRDPFFMMLRRSLNTFMNAFTSGDSTAYPFATQNRKDFDNLLTVYLDAVFFPTLDPLDFAQEGWRLDFASDKDDAELIYKGVVYNEMKGAMSAPSSQLWQELHAGIFSGTVYRYNSGGEPAHIPELSYEALKAFHAKHYHPSHAVLMTYGSFPVAEHQENFERYALSHFDRNGETIICPLQPRFDVPVVREATYAVTDPSELQRGTHAVWGWLTGQSADPMALLEGHLLADVLLDHGGSPLRKFLETTDLADAPSELCGLDDSGRELVVMCGVEGTDPEHIDRLDREIGAVLDSVAGSGVDEQTLEGVVDRMEMAQRDIGGDGYPYGLQLMSRALPGALYDGDPVALLDIDSCLDELRSRIADPAYIGSLVRRDVIDNTHAVRMTMRPDEHKAERDYAAERSRLDDILAQRTVAEREAIRIASARLEERQNEPQDADVLPKVTLEDVPKIQPTISGEVEALNSRVMHKYAAATNGLVSMQLVFDLPALTARDLDLLPLFCEYVTELGAGSESYLATQSRRAMDGNVGAYASARHSVGNPQQLTGRFVVTAKGLSRKSDRLATNLFEVLCDVRFDEYDRLSDLLAQSRVDTEASITDRGHVIAMHGAAAGLSAGAWLDDVWEGPAGVVTIQTIDRQCHDDADALKRLSVEFGALRERIVAAPSRIVVVAEDAVVADVAADLGRRAAPAPATPSHEPFALPLPPPQPNRAWLTNTQVSFCARAYAAVHEGHRDAPALSVLSRYLTDGYLHPAIREKGGAYGAGAQFDPASMSFRLFSYRDPRLAGTLADFDAAVPWLMQHRDPERLEESILGVIRSLDNPRSPAGTALRAFYDELDGRTPGFRRSFRESVLGTTIKDVVIVADRYLGSAEAATGIVTHAGRASDIEALHLEPVKL